MMNLFRKMLPLTILTAILVSLAYLAEAGFRVSELGNKHNLSSLNTDISVKYKAAEGDLRGTQICIFCHTPHSANVEGGAPLWNRAFSSETFQRYSSDTLRIGRIASAQYGDGAQPNGSSKLCLSCHDGVSKLGVLFSGAEIIMDTSLSGGFDYITGLASFKPDTNKMKTGHHPVSFVYLTGFNSKDNPQSGDIITGLPASYRFLPVSSVMLGINKVKLFDTSGNGNGWMQCTTCHDPHQNQADELKCYNNLGAIGDCGATFTRNIAPFWVYHGTGTSASEDTGTVCKVCHSMGTADGFAPWSL